MSFIVMKSSDVKTSAQFTLTHLMEVKAAYINEKIKKITTPVDDELTAVIALTEAASYAVDTAQDTMHVSVQDFASIQHNLPARG
jgi:hypothetical protein